jgi:hypothetical protein
MHRFLSVLVASFLLVAPVARAEEPETSGLPDDFGATCADLEARVAKHKEAKDEKALAADLDDLRKAYPKAIEPKHRERLNGVLGTILKGTRSESVEKAALEACGSLGDPAHWKLLRPYVQQPNPKVAPRLINEALAAVGALKPDDAVPHLLRLVEKSKVYPIAASAIKTLGCYGSNKKWRAKILEALVGTVKKSIPGGGSRSKSDPNTGATVSGKAGDDGSRWGTISPAFVAAANQLTGHTAATPEDWFDLCDQYKGRLEDLFAS